MQCAVVCFLCYKTCKLFTALLNADLPHCLDVRERRRRRLIDGDGNRLRRSGEDVGRYGRQFLDIHRPRWEIAGGNCAICARGKLGNFVFAGAIGENPKLHAGEFFAVLAVLDDFQLAKGGRLHGQIGGGDHLRGGGAEKYLLQAEMCIRDRL